MEQEGLTEAFVEAVGFAVSVALVLSPLLLAHHLSAISECDPTDSYSITFY